MEVPTEDFPVRQKQLSVDIKASEIIDHIYIFVCVWVYVYLFVLLLLSFGMMV